MLENLPYLSLSEAAEYCDCTEEQLLRLAERGDDYLELLYNVDYAVMELGPVDVPFDRGDSCNFLVIPSINIKELLHNGQTLVKTFLVPKSVGRTAIMLDIVQRLSLENGGERGLQIHCISEQEVKTENIYIMRASLDRACNKDTESTSRPTYLTLKEASQVYGVSVNRLLVEATKGCDRIELLYWVQCKDIHRKYEHYQFDGPTVAGDYLVVPSDRVVELRHQGHTAIDCFYFPTRSPMHESMVQLRNEKRLYSGQNPERGPEFIRCETILLIGVEDENLVVTAGDLDRLWPSSRPNASNRFDRNADVPTSLSADEKQTTYPTELQVALEAQEQFSSNTGASKTRGVIEKYIKERLLEKGDVPVTDTTCRRIAELITCDEIPIVIEAYEAVYGKNSRATRSDMEFYLYEHHGLKETSAAFRRIVAVTTPDNRKKIRK